jgi:hypothetical protein
MKKLILLLLLCPIFSIGQSNNFRFIDFLEKAPNELTTFCIHDQIGIESFLSKEGITVKYRTENWLFITATASWMNENQKNGKIEQFYFEHAPPTLLNDSSMVMMNAVSAHNGTDGLQTPYTGEGVIIAYVDQGLDWNHPDFQTADGKTRVLRYWDHSINGGPNAFNYYGYGRLWTGEEIDNGTCTSYEENTSHGTTVAGAGSGNGLANGRNKGVAPNSNIVIIESNFNLANWTLSIADACDYVFKLADSLNMPAVVNLSLGTYLGSHDGNDPASEYMEQLVDEKPGRIIVCAAGNSGLKGNYHCQAQVTADTSFVWFLNNPSGAIAPNTIYFDLWAEVADAANINFAFGADTPSPGYDFRGRTSFYNMVDNAGSVIFDTIYNGSNRIATIQIYPSLVDGVFHMEAYFADVDSTSYYYRFETTGTGKYDLWSGSFMGLNSMVTVLPDPSDMPDIIYYNAPDSNQTIVSSWNCSEKIISTGNVTNRMTYLDKNSNYYVPTVSSPVGSLCPNSSKGPSRVGYNKPDISAPGEVTLSPASFWMLNNAVLGSFVDELGMHARNSGTSMASPKIAGIAALYLEKCRNATYQDFIDDLTSSAVSDGFTGTTPNNGYGYGKVDALAVLLSTNYATSVIGDTAFCFPPLAINISSENTMDSIWWSSNTNTPSYDVLTPGQYWAEVFDPRGCKSYTDTVTISQYEVLDDPIISIESTIITSDEQPNYQWQMDGADIIGEIDSILDVQSNQTASYNVYTTSDDGCVSYSNTINVYAGINGNEISSLKLLPNPSSTSFKIESEYEINEIRIIDINGKETTIVSLGNNNYSISHLVSGSYYIEIHTESGIFHSKFIKM